MIEWAGDGQRGAAGWEGGDGAAIGSMYTKRASPGIPRCFFLYNIGSERKWNWRL